MKKMILILSLCLVAASLQGCIRYVSGCLYTGSPGAPYFVRYPDGVEIHGTVGSSGQIKPNPRGYACSQLIVFVGFSFGLALSASPSSVYLPSPPTSGTITGQSFDATYGMPRVDYYDGDGYLVDSVYATSVSADATSLQANFPDLSSVYSGTYQVKVTNMRSDGYYLNTVGSASMTGWGRDRPDSDGDGWFDDEDCDPFDPFYTDNCVQVCGGGNEPIYVCP
jgi:hypothetical protein